MNGDFYGDHFKPFIGIVEKEVDSEYVKVRILGIHPSDKGKVPTEMLPQSLVSYPTTGGQVKSGSASHNIEADSWVWGWITDYPYCMNLIVCGVFQGGHMSMSSGQSNGGAMVGQDGASTSTGSESVSSVTTNIPGSNNIQKTYNYVYAKLKAEGSSDPHLHTSAILGGLLLETTGINPATVNSIGAWGICQWLHPRRPQLFARHGKTKDLGAQLDFMWWEMNNTERRSKGQILRATNMPDAVAGMCMFERAEEVRKGRLDRSHKNYQKRLSFAYQVYNKYKYGGSGGEQSGVNSSGTASFNQGGTVPT